MYKQNCAPPPSQISGWAYMSIKYLHSKVGTTEIVVSHFL